MATPHDHTQELPDSQESQEQLNNGALAHYQAPPLANGLSEEFRESPTPTPATTSSAMFSSFSTLAPSDSASVVKTSESISSLSRNLNQAITIDDDDDDCVVVKTSTASKHPGQGWVASKKRFIESSQDGQPIIMTEPEVKKEPSPDIALSSLSRIPSTFGEILAAQKEMFRRKQGLQTQQPPQPERTFHSIFGPKKTARFLGNAPSGQQNVDENAGPSRRHDGEQSVDDHAWMDGGLEQDSEYNSLKKFCDVLKKKQAKCRLSAEEDIELLQTQERIELLERLQKRARDANEELEEAMFIPDDHPLDTQSIQTAHRENVPWKREDGLDRDSPEMIFPGGMDEGDEDLARYLQQDIQGGLEAGEGFSPPPKEMGKKPRKPRKKPAKNAREFFAQREDMRREKERKKSHKTQAKNASNPTTAGRRRGRPDGPKRSGKTNKKGKGKARAGPESGTHGKNLMREENADNFRLLFANMLSNDAISDRLRAGYDPQPQVAGSKNKETQLKQIIASVPKSLSLRQRGRDRQDILNASRSFGYAGVKAKDGKWLPKGMKSSLFHHQLLGARFMLERELSQRPPYGGINADAMGLGKTVEMLATMVGNPPSADDKKKHCKTTLIVVPSAVISQWLEEIRKHVNTSVFPRVLHFKASRNIPLITIQDQDIVITSYAEVMNSFPYPDRQCLAKLRDEGLEKWLREADEYKGDLHRIQWYRVVLDEAHAIKNYKGRTSIACQNLTATYRWCLTGTPVLNRLEELYPYLRFLRVGLTNSYDEFVQHFCDPDAPDCQKRITALLSFTMIRRSMNTKLLGRAIISLKDPHPEIIHIEFSKEERIIYRITENRFRQIINMRFARGSAQNSYGYFLVQLLRLRQCTSHPFMIEQTIKECWNAEDLAELKSKLKKIRSEGLQKVYDQCKLWMDEAQVNPDKVDPMDGGSFNFGEGDYGHEFKMQKYLKKSDGFDEQAFMDRVVCNLCSDVPQDPQITDCSHIFCKECLTGYMHRRAAEDLDYTECPTCQLIITSTQPYRDANLQFPDDDAVGSQVGGSQNRDGGENGSWAKRSRRAYGHGMDALGFEPTTRTSRWLDQSDADQAPLLPSAKTTALKAKLLKWFYEAPNDKVVVFTQFRLLSKIVGRIAAQEKWEFLYYSGEASDQHRTKVIDEFHRNPRIKLLIAGLKCGGQGLNLTIANRCISLDLWWNHAVEQQAFGRIFRIGQPKETYFTRVCVRNTVEMRMLAMQVDKLRMIDQMMQEGVDDAKLPKLDINELASLFGFLDKNEDGTFVVRPDYIPEEGDDDDDEDNNGTNGEGLRGAEQLVSDDENAMDLDREDV
ncbi:hypothetical protein BP5796_05085 [Coleophoma crateriformis]|uniref:Uncharacterized protein n=1 Tax=Coleophoma crateriformis TaxID=565419 RepID=A0A3D8S265_9HELO|nr:hypothetical protein BP5796_05085 [Coleophoma crateriformis]